MFSCRLIRAKEFRDLQKENMSTRNANTILYYYHFIYQINQDMIPNTNCDPVMNSITISMITMPNAFGHELYRSYGDLCLIYHYHHLLHIYFSHHRPTFLLKPNKKSARSLPPYIHYRSHSINYRLDESTQHQGRMNLHPRLTVVCSCSRHKFQRYIRSQHCNGC